MSQNPSLRVARACTACRRRKVKCSGHDRCHQCAHSGLRCEYGTSSSTRRTGTQRGIVLSSLSTSNRKTSNVPLLPRLDHGTPRSPSPEYLQSQQRDSSFTNSLVQEYMEIIYPTHPIIDQDDLNWCILNMTSDCVAEALVNACGAAVRCARQDAESVDIVYIRELLNHAMAVQSAMLPGFHASIYRAMTCVLIANCLMFVEEPAASFIYLRQAVSLFELLHMRPSNAISSRSEEFSKLRRLHCLLFVHERYQAIAEFRTPIMQQPDIVSGSYPQESSIASVGFKRITKLFGLLDNTFVNLWLDKETDTSIDISWIQRKSEEFRQDSDDAQEEVFKLSATQYADLTVTRSWLLSILWRIALSRRLLADLPREVFFSVLFPVQVIRQLRENVGGLTTRAITTHGIGIVQKLFEIADIVADLLIYEPISMDGLRQDLHEDFKHLRDKILSYHIDDVRRSILLEKSDRIKRRV